MQILITGDDNNVRFETFKIQAVAKFVGTSLTVRPASSNEQNLTLPCLTANDSTFSGGNVVCKLLIASSRYPLYPQAPFSPDKRYRAAQIDAWLDWGTIKLRIQQVTAPPAATHTYCLLGEGKICILA